MEIIDLTDIEWHRLSEAGSSCGMLYKATLNIAGTIHFYKMSLMIGRKVVGHEAVNEVIISRLLDVLGLPHVEYNLLLAKVNIHGNNFNTFICESKDFRQDTGETLPFELYYNLVGTEKTPLEFAQFLGFQSFLNELFVIDFLIINRDRHGYNLEITRNSSGIKPVMLFDMGYSLIAPLRDDMRLIQAFDPLSDVVTNNFIGSESLYDNLKYITKPVYVNPLTDKVKSKIFYKLGIAISKEHLNKIWKIITCRYRYLYDNGYICVKPDEHTAIFD